MDTPTRLRLYQYTYSPYCIPIELALAHSGIPYDLVNLNVGDPAPVIQLTKGDYYMVPVLEDLFNHEIIYDKSPAGDDVPRYIESLAPLMRLFPDEVSGEHQIYLSYIENECESKCFKPCDALWDKWIKSDLERGLHRRQKERKFGLGCLEDWLRTINQHIADFHHCIQPFEKILGKKPFLTGERPVYADYALCGVIGMFLFPGTTSLPENCLMIEAWYTKMRAGNFRTGLDDMQLGSSGTGDALTDGDSAADLSDVEKAIAELKLRANTTALDLATGTGQTAIYLAGKGMQVTASDMTPAVLDHARKLATEAGATINFQAHPAEKLPYPDNSFGLVTCRNSAHLFKSPDFFIRESARVLKTYGYLVLIDSTVPDDHIEAHEWMDALEKLRNPAHGRFISPNVWRRWCVEAGLTMTKLQVESFKQPDINWYFNIANTPPDNRKKVLEMIAKAPASVRELFKIGQEDGKIIWWWRRVTLVAGKM